MKTKQTILDEFEKRYVAKEYSENGKIPVVGGNWEKDVKIFLSKALDEQRKETIREMIKEIEKMKLGGHRDEDKRIFAGGYDNAIDDIIKKIKEL